MDIVDEIPVEELTPRLQETFPHRGSLKRLEEQNVGLATSRWIVHERYVDAAGKGVRLVLGVEETAVAVLKAQKMQPYWGIGRTSFRLLDAHPNKSTEDRMDVEEGATQDGEYAPVHTN